MGNTVGGGLGGIIGFCFGNSVYQVAKGGLKLTKADLVKIICENLGLPLKESTEIMEQVFEILKETLEGGEKIKISGFGNFVVRQKRPRRGRNPQTGGEIVISRRKVVTFKPSPVLRKALNKTEGSESESQESKVF
jgi:integration host factor subunit alpha